MEKGVRLEYVNGRNGVESTIDNWICIDVALREAIDPIRISVRGGTATSREFSEMRSDHFSGVFLEVTEAFGVVRCCDC